MHRAEGERRRDDGDAQHEDDEAAPERARHGVRLRAPCGERRRGRRRRDRTVAACTMLLLGCAFPPERWRSKSSYQTFPKIGHTVFEHSPRAESDHDGFRARRGRKINRHLLPFALADGDLAVTNRDAAASGAAASRISTAMAWPRFSSRPCGRSSSGGIAWTAGRRRLPDVAKIGLPQTR